MYPDRKIQCQSAQQAVEVYCFEAAEWCTIWLARSHWLTIASFGSTDAELSATMSSIDVAHIVLWLCRLCLVQRELPTKLDGPSAVAPTPGLVRTWPAACPLAVHLLATRYVLPIYSLASFTLIQWCLTLVYRQFCSEQSRDRERFAPCRTWDSPSASLQ